MGMNLSEMKGLFYRMICAIALTVQTSMAKVLTYSSHASYITFVRCLFLVFTVPFIEFNQASTCDTTDLILYLSLGVLGIIPISTSILSFTFIGVGDSVAIEFGGNVILVGVIGHFLLDEKLSISYFILLLVDCVGIILVVRPSFIFGTSKEGITSKETGGIIALSGACSLSFFEVLIRKLRNRDTLHCFLFMVVQGFVGMILAGAWTTVESAWEIPNTWLNACMIAGYGVVNIIQFVFLAKALANAEAKNVALALTLSIVLSYALQLTIFEEDVDWVSIGGAVIIALCVVLSASWDYLFEKLSSFRPLYETLSDYNPM